MIERKTDTIEPDCIACSVLPTISQLPTETIQEIGYFLEPNEAAIMSQTCSSISTDLSLRSHSSLANGSVDSIVTLRGGQHEGNPPICIGAIVPQYDDFFHSVTMKFNWKDQGRGRRKGRLFVVAHDIPKDLDALSSSFEQSLRDLRFKKKQIVYRSPFAHHRTSSLQFPICPKPNKIYQIWCKVGPASSFSLTFKDISVHMTAFGNRVPTCALYQFQQNRLPPPFVSLTTRAIRTPRFHNWYSDSDDDDTDSDADEHVFHRATWVA